MADIKQFTYVSEILSSRLEADEVEIREVKELLDLHVSKRQLARLHQTDKQDESILSEKIKDCQYEYHSLRIEMIEIRKVLQMIAEEREKVQKIKNLPSSLPAQEILSTQCC